MTATISSHHVSQTRDGWTLTGVTLTDHDGPSLTLATTVGTALHYIWDSGSSLTLPADGRCVISMLITGSTIPRIAIGTHPSDTSKELAAIFDLQSHAFAGWGGNQTTQNNSATITQESGGWRLTVNIDFSSSYGGRGCVLHVWLLDGTTGIRQSWAAGSVQSVDMRDLRLDPPGSAPTPNPTPNPNPTPTSHSQRRHLHPAAALAIIHCLGP